MEIYKMTWLAAHWEWFLVAVFLKFALWWILLPYNLVKKIVTR